MPPTTRDHTPPPATPALTPHTPHRSALSRETRTRGATPRKAAQMDFRILPLASAENKPPTERTDTPAVTDPGPPPQLPNARESRQRYRERGDTPRKVSAGNSVPLFASAPRTDLLRSVETEGGGSLAPVLPAGLSVPATERERERRERRLFRQHGTPRRVADAGFRIQPIRDDAVPGAE